jgi:hypothetical protein
LKKRCCQTQPKGSQLHNPIIYCDYDAPAAIASWHQSVVRAPSVPNCSARKFQLVRSLPPEIEVGFLVEFLKTVISAVCGFVRSDGLPLPVNSNVPDELLISNPRRSRRCSSTSRVSGRHRRSPFKSVPPAVPRTSLSRPLSASASFSSIFTTLSFTCHSSLASSTCRCRRPC